jgi:FecR protein
MKLQSPQKVALILAGLLLSLSPVAAQQVTRVRVDRWLAVSALSGSVTRQQGNRSQTAQMGDRIQSVGDGITTGGGASARLDVDTGIGSVYVSEGTKMRIQGMEVAPDNGRITRLQVLRGQVRLKVRRFTHGGSRLEIQTPSGLSGVRGTEFGVAVQPSGKTGMAVLEGKVVSSAQGREVVVNQGFQVFTIPGEPPSPPQPLRDDPSLEYRFEKTIEQGIRRARLVGKVDPVNTVIVAGVPQSTDREGRFRTDVKLVPSFFKLQVIVNTPLGKQKVYDLALD